MIENPFKEGQIVVTDKCSLSQILESYEHIGLKKTLHTPTEENGKIDDLSREEKVLATENFIQNEYNDKAGGLFGLGVFFLGIGITLTYLFFKPLFDFGAYGPPRYRVKSIYEAPVEEVPPEVVNNPNFIDQAGRIFSRFAGLVLGTLPFLLGLYLGVKNLRKARSNKRLSKRMDHLKNLELEIIPDANLSSFQKESEDLIFEMREHIQKFLAGKNRETKLTICSQIEGKLRRIYNLSKSYGCDEVSSYYEDLEASFSELKHAIKKSRFWKPEKKNVRILFGDVG
ncbi:MAG: hypothetical protein ACFFCW_15045 [Candidatus Hodarchaeota archaeon]